MNGKNESQNLQTRAQLKKYFQNGLLPTEKHFGYLIDSMSNRLDDGFSLDEENGLMLTPTRSSAKYISFFDKIGAAEPSWSIQKNTLGGSGLNFSSGKDRLSLHLSDKGKVGVGTDEPKYTLDAAGLVGMHGRIGTYASGEVPADGKYHDILTGLNNCHAFEIVARAGEKGTGKYALMHASALSTFGKSRNKIRKTCAFYKWFWNRLKIRWSGDTYDYKLQLGTWWTYGENEKGKAMTIQYHITKLWSDEDFVPAEELHT